MTFAIDEKIRNISCENLVYEILINNKSLSNIKQNDSCFDYIKFIEIENGVVVSLKVDTKSIHTSFSPSYHYIVLAIFCSLFTWSIYYSNIVRERAIRHLSKDYEGKILMEKNIIEQEECINQEFTKSLRDKIGLSNQSIANVVFFRDDIRTSETISKHTIKHLFENLGGVLNIKMKDTSIDFYNKAALLQLVYSMTYFIKWLIPENFSKKVIMSISKERGFLKILFIFKGFSIESIDELLNIGSKYNEHSNAIFKLGISQILEMLNKADFECYISSKLETNTISIIQKRVIDSEGKIIVNFDAIKKTNAKNKKHINDKENLRSTNNNVHT